MNKRILAIALTALLAMGLLGGCAAQNKSPAPETGKLRVVATLFPQYDFVRQIGGDRVEAKMLLSPGMESHTYDPTPSDMIAVGEAALFVYTGAGMEPWAQKILESVDSSVRGIDLSAGMVLADGETVEKHSLTADEVAADHTGETHLYDPHIWTSPRLAKQMAQTVLAALQEADPQNAVYYAQNAERYFAQIDLLDARFREIVKSAKRNEMVFGSRFAESYFVLEYGLSYASPYDSCSGETEPSAKALARVIDLVREKEIPVIYYQELAETKVAESIAESTGARMLLFHSCHNLSKEEFTAGETYLSLMEQNAENLREGLSE